MFFAPPPKERGVPFGGYLCSPRVCFGGSLGEPAPFSEFKFSPGDLIGVFTQPPTPARRVNLAFGDGAGPVDWPKPFSPAEIGSCHSEEGLGLPSKQPTSYGRTRPTALPPNLFTPNSPTPASNQDTPNWPTKITGLGARTKPPPLGFQEPLPVLPGPPLLGWGHPLA